MDGADEGVAVAPFFKDFTGAVLFPEFASNEFGVGGEGTLRIVGGDFFDRGVVFSGFETFLRRQVEAGDLQAVEKETGAARVEFILGEFLENLTDAVLDGAAVFHERERECLGAAATATDVLCAAARGVVVVAEVFVAVGFAETWGAAAASVGEDVAALEAFGLFEHG